MAVFCICQLLEKKMGYSEEVS